MMANPIRIILEDMSKHFDWSGISPAIFGSIFETTLNTETRHHESIHYTSIENIHKLIDPRTQKLLAFQDKLASLRFLDPACGSGNFLTENYMELRRLENKVLRELPPETNVKVSITQFHGIEIN